MYLPATLPLLRQALLAGGLGPAPLAGFALTADLREAYATGGAEELEYAAQLAAARASLGLLVADPQAPPRRVVLAVDAPAVPTSEAGPASVRLLDPLPWAAVAAGLIDGREAEPAVRAAARAWSAAGGDPDDAAVEAALDALEDHALLWWAAQELDRLDELDR